MTPHVFSTVGIKLLKLVCLNAKFAIPALHQHLDVMIRFADLTLRRNFKSWFSRENFEFTLVKNREFVIGKPLISAWRPCPSITHVMDTNLMPSRHAKWSPLGGLVSSSRFVFPYSPKFNKNFCIPEMNSIKSFMQSLSLMQSEFNKNKSLGILKVKLNMYVCRN